MAALPGLLALLAGFLLTAPALLLAALPWLLTTLLAGFLLAAATLLAALAAALRLLAGFLFTRVHTSSFVGPPTQNEKRALRVPLILRSEAREERRRLLHGLAAPRASHLEAASLVTMKVLGMHEAVQLPRRKHRRSLSPEFQHAFALEVLKTERLRIIALIVVATAVADGLGAVDLLVPAVLDRIWHGRFPVLFLAISYIVFVSFEASVLVLIGARTKRGA